MAELTKIRLSGQTYDIVDESALHTLDASVTSGGTNAVNGSGIYNAIASALETVAEQGYQTSGDVQSAISGKADTTAVTQSINEAVSGKANTSDVITNIATHNYDQAIGIHYSKNGGIVNVQVAALGTGLISPKASNEISIDTTVIAQKTDIPSVSGYADSVKYNSTSKYVEFYHGGTGGTKVFEYDASPFLIDGMVQNVEVKDVTLSGESVTCLVITFNTDAGKQEIDIPISQIFDASNYYTKSEVDTALAAKANTATTYTKTETDNAIDAATSGKVDTTTFNTYSGSVETALSGKQDTLVNQTNIKSINGESLLGSGNITIEQGTVDQTVISGSTNAVAGGAVYDELQGKQATLISGTNIKTVGNESVLGSGNIKLMTASVGTGNDSTTLIFDFA